jgi:polyisoprenoid-binding protein YceI
MAILMPVVHGFTIDNELYLDTRVPFQYRGNGKSAAARAFELSALVSFLEANIALPGAPSQATVTLASSAVAISGGKLLEKIVVIGSGPFFLGTAAAGTDIIDAGTAQTTGAVFVVDRYFLTSATLHFSGFSGTLTVKLYTR